MVTEMGKKQGWRPDVIVVDPPRTGCDDKLLETILKSEAETSCVRVCNPSSLARDVQALMKSYEVEYVQPVDMFPHTAHVEYVVKLVRKKSLLIFPHGMRDIFHEGEYYA